MKRLPEIILVFITIYLFFAFAAPVFLKLGMTDVGMGIHSVYRIFCHQRVERSAFFFGEDGIITFYTRDELQERGAIPESNPAVPEPFSERIFGYPFVGNEEVGYKMPLCIRDVPLYLAFGVFGWIYLISARRKKKIKKYPYTLVVVLMVPMIVDGIFQYTAEFLRWGFVPEYYFDNIPKRIITGVLFGIGFAMLIIPNLMESVEMLYNNESESNLKNADNDNEKPEHSK